MAAWLTDALASHAGRNLDRKDDRDFVAASILRALPRRAMMIAVLSSLIRQAYEMAEDPKLDAAPKDIAEAVVTAIADLLGVI